METPDFEKTARAEKMFDILVRFGPVQALDGANFNTRSFFDAKVARLISYYAKKLPRLAQKTRMHKKFSKLREAGFWP